MPELVSNSVNLNVKEEKVVGPWKVAWRSFKK